VVSLELAGYDGAIDPEACYEELMAAAAASFLEPAPGRRSDATGGRQAPET
jgi:hypothetical protein